MLINSIFLENAIEDFMHLLSETFLNFFFFLIWTVLKSLLNLLQYCLCFMFGFLASRHVES